MSENWGGIVQDRGRTSLTTIAATIADEKIIKQGLLVCAGDPVLARMKANLEPHRRHHPSAVDSIGIIDIEGTKVGSVGIVVGAIGDSGLFAGDPLREPDGDQDKGFILRFIEWGTSKQRASPWARPALDAEQPHIAGRLVAFLKLHLNELLGRVK